MTDEEVRLECLKLAYQRKVTGFGDLQDPTTLEEEADRLVSYVKHGTTKNEQASSQTE